MIEIDDITTYFSEEKHKVIIKIKAQEWQDITPILSTLETQIYETLETDIKVQFEILRVFQL
jgi:hypothetical protein